MTESGDLEMRVRDLSTRMRQMETTQETFIDEVIDQVLQLLGMSKALKYIPDLKRIEDEMKMIKHNMDADVELLRETVLTVTQPQVPPKSLMASTDRSDMDGIRNKLSTLDQMMHEKFATLDYEVKEKLTNLKHEINNHPLNPRVDKLEDDMINYVTKDLFRSVQDSLIDYATSETTDVLLRKINRLDEKFVTRPEYEMGNEEIKVHIEEKLAEKLSIQDFNDNLNNLDADVETKLAPILKSQETYRKTIKKLQKDFMEVVEVANSQTELLKGKVDFTEIDKIWINFDKYCMYDDLKDLYMKTVPEIAKFEVKLEDFCKDIEKQTQILRRFDEILLEKASKGNLSDFQTNIERKYTLLENFTKHKDEILAKTEKMCDQLTEVNDMIDILGKQITKDIFAAVKRATSHLKNSQSAAGGMGTGEMIQMAEELKTLVAQKADQQTLLDLNATKANKVDTQLSMRWIEVINRQIKQIVVLITEILRFEVDKTEAKDFSGEQHMQYVRAFLLQQALLIGQWVNKFHTSNVNEYFLESSQGATELNWTPPEIQAFEKYAEEQLNDMDLDSIMTRNQALAKNMKFRSKSVLQNGQFNLAKTQTNFTQSQMSPRSPKRDIKSGAGHFVNNKVQYLQNAAQINSCGRQSTIKSANMLDNSNYGNNNSVIEFSTAKQNLRGSVTMKTSMGIPGYKAMTPMIATTFTHNHSISGEQDLTLPIDTKKTTLSNMKQLSGRASNLSFNGGIANPTKQVSSLADRDSLLQSMMIVSPQNKKVHYNAAQLRKSLNLPGIKNQQQAALNSGQQ